MGVRNNKRGLGVHLLMHNGYEVLIELQQHRYADTDSR
jgi:hypothetical protein